MRRDPAEVSKQLNRYADTFTALSFTQTMAVIVALNFQHMVVKYDPGLPLLTYVISGFLVYFCHLGENALFEKDAESKIPDKWTRYIFYGRVAIICISAGIFTFTGYLPIAVGR